MSNTVKIRRRDIRALERRRDFLLERTFGKDPTKATFDIAEATALSRVIDRLKDEAVLDD